MIQRITALICIILIVSCGNANKNGSNNNADVLNSKAMFSCKVDGKEFIPKPEEFNLNMVRTITAKQYVVIGDNADFNIGLNIPYDAKVGEEIKNCEVIVTEPKAKITYMPDYGENIKIVLSSKKKGYIAGTFSFDMNRTKVNNLPVLKITEGKFGTAVLYDE